MKTESTDTSRTSDEPYWHEELQLYVTFDGAYYWSDQTQAWEAFETPIESKTGPAQEAKAKKQQTEETDSDASRWDEDLQTWVTGDGNYQWDDQVQDWIEIQQTETNSEAEHSGACEGGCDDNQSTEAESEEEGESFWHAGHHAWISPEGTHKWDSAVGQWVKLDEPVKRK